MRAAAAALLCALAASACAAAADWDEPAAEAGATARELGIRPERFPTPLTLPAVEAMLEDPASAPTVARRWGQALERSRGLADVLAAASEVAFSSAPAAAALSSGAFACPGLPVALAGSVGALAAAVSRAEAAVARAGAALSPAQKRRLADSFGAVLRHEPLASVSEEDVALAGRFDAAAVVAAARTLAEAAQAQLPALQASTAAVSGRLRCGSTLVAGSGDDVYRPGDLDGVSLLIDLGGRSSYAARLAAAGAGEVRLAIDLGASLSIEASSSATAGSGAFGIGLFYAPTAGSKTIEAGDFSLGAGLFGVGGALVAGPVRATSGHFGQGAGAFGAGAFVVLGASTSLSADYASQGFGFTRGAGIMIARGAGLEARCGLKHADPREASLAMLSLCQGVGDGPRAHAAGGVGLALVAGDGASLLSSYFAQGAGYWHAFGGLYVRGDGARAQARRYVQGTGVHAGAGWLSWRGSRGLLATWGVGPAFGWDYGVGLLELQGDDNALRAEWASGRGDVNGRALAQLTGARNSLRLSDWGTATFKRAAAGYALIQTSGEGNRLWSPGLARSREGAFDAMTTPWGVVRSSGGLTLAPELSVATVAWPTADPAADAARARALMAQALAQADRLPPERRAARWLALASAESLDGQGTMSAAGRLVALPRERIGDVVAQMTVEGFDEALWVRLAASAAGRSAAEAAKAELARASGLRRALLADLLRYGDASEAFAQGRSLLRERDWRLRRAGAFLIGAALGGEQGEEPGRLRFLAQSAELARSTFTAGSPAEDAAFKAIGYKRLPDLYSVLALDERLAADDRLALLSAGDPFDTVKTPALRLFTRALRAKSAFYGPAIDRELERATALRVEARAALRSALADPDPDARAAAYAALGQVGAEEDAARLASGLADGSTVSREAAALGLARLGRAALGAISDSLSKGAAVSRRAAALAAAQSPDAEVADLTLKALSDADAFVRLSAVGALGAVPQPHYERLRKAAVPQLQKLSESDASPSVRASAARLLGQIAPSGS